MLWYLLSPVTALRFAAGVLSFPLAGVTARVDRLRGRGTCVCDYFLYFLDTARRKISVNRYSDRLHDTEDRGGGGGGCGVGTSF